MHILWFTVAALYASALAFVAGELTGHVVVARQQGNFGQSNVPLVVALVQFVGLVIVGLILVRRARAGAGAEDTLPLEHSAQRRTDAIATAIELAEESAVSPALRAVGDSAEPVSAVQPVLADVMPIVAGEVADERITANAINMLVETTASEAMAQTSEMVDTPAVESPVELVAMQEPGHTEPVSEPASEPSLESAVAEAVGRPPEAVVAGDPPRTDVFATTVSEREVQPAAPDILEMSVIPHVAEVVESSCESRVADVVERAIAAEVGEVRDTLAEPAVGGALESHAELTVDTGVEQAALPNVGEVRERLADWGVADVADVADRLAEGTAPVAVPPAINLVTTEHVAGLVEPGVGDSRARAIERPRETLRVKAMDRRARARRVQTPSKPGPAPYAAAPRIIIGKSREAITRAWVGGGALIVVGGGVFALGGRVPFGGPIAALLAVLGLWLVTRAVTGTVAGRRVGRTWVQLRTSPIAPGTELEGLVWSSSRRLRRAVRCRKPMRPARVRLLCLRAPAPTRRGTSMTNSALVWQKEVAVKSDRMTVSTGHLGVPFRFDVPADVLEMSRPGEPNPIIWLLSVEMATDGIALAEQFALPIYQPEPIVPRSAA